MADPYNIPDPMAIELATRAYGPVYGAQYANAMKSAQANELGHKLGLPSDIVESDMPNMMADARIKRRLADIQRNQTYARIMSTPITAAAMDDDHLPKVADKVDQTIDASKLSFLGKASLYGSSILKSFPAASSALYSALQMGADNVRAIAQPGSPVDIGMGKLSGWLGYAADASQPKMPVTTNPYLNAVLSGGGSFGPSVMAGVSALFGQPEAGGALMGGVTAGQSYQQARQSGATVGQSTDSAIQQGIEETMFETLGGRYFHGFAESGKGFFNTLAKQTMAEIATEVPTTIMQDFSQWAAVDRNHGKSFGDFVAQLGPDIRDTIIATAAMAAPMIGGSYGLHHIVANHIEKQASVVAAQHVDKIMEAAAQSSTRTANPTDFAMALNQVLEDTPAEHLYVPAEEIAKLFEPKEGEAAPSITDDPFWSRYAQDVQEGAALGHDVVIPLGDAATHLAGTPQWDALKDHVRVSPQGMSLAEAKEKATPEDLDKIAGRMTELVEEALPRMQQAQALQITRNFAQAGGYTNEQAEPVNRMLAAHLYTVYRSEMAKVTEAGGKPISMEEFAAQHLPTIEKQTQAHYDRATKTGTLEQENEGEQGSATAAGVDNAAAGSVRDQGRLPGSPGVLAAEPGQELGLDQPVAGAPQSLTVPGRGKVAVVPHPPARQAASSYMRRSGLVYLPATRYAKLDVERATRIAAAFEEMTHQPNDPLVAAAYDAMIAETLAQFDEIRRTGLRIEFIEEGMENPYAASPRLAIIDVHENNHLWVFPTEGGFGQGEVTDSPMLQPTGIVIDGRQLLANDVFRIVHDYFGHIKDGHGFRAEGEENAWQSHAAMYSPLARRAMTTETRGQNSWLNYGPNGNENRTADQEATKFAPQVVALMPEWVSEEGMLADPESGKERLTYDQNVETRPVFSAPYDLDRYGDGQELSRPPVDEDGNVQLDHFAQGEIEDGVTDPSRWGQGKSFYSRGERAYMRDAPPRTYFGIATNQPGGYKLEFVGRTPYRAKLPVERLYDPVENSAGLWQRGQYAESEQAIKDAGFAGYWVKHPQLGLVAVVFEPVEVESAEPEPLTLNQSVEPTGFERVAPFLTDEEKAKMREASKAKLLDIVDTLPKAEEMAAVARAGRAKKGWYQRSAQAIVDVFGIEDAPRFAALLAALSPQSPVELNFYNAVKVWTGWNNAGRPTDRQTIVQVMGENVAGNKGTASVMTAWINNSVAALSDAAPGSLKLSGPKVNSFFANLIGVTDEVTNDTWMLRWAGLERPSGIGVNGDKGTIYKAMNAVTRQAARVLTEKTGQDWTPSEVQETVWSFAKTLYEMRDQAGENRTMRELLEAGGITHQDIAATPDFAVLFTDNIFRRILEEGGYGQQVEDLESSGRAVHVDGGESAVASSEGSGFTEDDFRAFLASSADRLEAIRDQRRANAEERRRDARQLGLTLNQDVTPSEEVFYSNATRAVENAKQEKASPEQWAALLTPGRTPGIKAEEIEWTGILDWLKMQKGQIDKAALLQVLRDRGIKVEEVVLGEAKRRGPEWQAEVDRRTQIQLGIEADERELEDDDRQQFINDNWGTTADEVEGQMDRDGTDITPQFQNWSSDPSNDTYRELLITMPLGQGSNPERAPSTHWDTEGVVAHVRFMEKTDAEGKRVLFIEEVQSDWHQKGRDQGYANPAPQEEIDEAQKNADTTYAAFKEARRLMIDEAVRIGLMERGDLTDEQNEGTAASKVHGFIQSTADEGDHALELYKAYRAAQLASAEANQILQNAKGGKGIPDAPFKTSWPALVMKRSIRWAAEHGFDKVAWTTGEEQASRYNLSQATGAIDARPHTDGERYRVELKHQAAVALHSQGLASEISGMIANDANAVLMTADQLKTAFGENISRQIIDGAVGSSEVHIDGEGLNVGGEGMKAFYDRNLVNITNDIVKKYGVKVGPVLVGHPADFRDLEVAESMGDLDVVEKGRAGLQRPGFEITPQLREAAMGGFPLFQNRRGNITITPGDNGLMRSALIRAFEASNFSTAVHELGHFFLEDLKRRALGSNPRTQEQADWQTYKDWVRDTLGIEVDDNAPVPVPAHELFAKGFERYTWEGKAPSLGLRAVFTRMREFMFALYRSARIFNAPITPEIRDVMGRMLASQEEIDAQRKEMNLVSKAIKGLLSETEQKAYDDLAEEGRQSARDQLFERVLSGLRNQARAKHRVETDAIRAEVEAQVGDQPIYRALKLLRVGQLLPDGNFAKVKLDRQWLADTYGDGIEAQLPKSVPPIVSDNDTMDADHIAALAGYGSGDEMVRAMIEHEAQRVAAKAAGEKRSPRQREVDEQVDERVKQEVGDPFAHLEEEAQDAIASNKQADLMSMEVRALARKTGQKPTPWKMAKEWAEKRIALQSAREAISGKAIQMYARAIAKAGREYEEFLIKGDFEEAFRAKQRQLLNMALMSEAKKAANDVDAAVRRMQKLAKRDTIPSIDQDYLEQAHALLNDVDFKSNGAQADRATSFAEWHARQVDLGVLPVVPPGYRELLGKTHWSKLTVPELLELDTAVGQIIELGRLKKKLLDGKAQRDFDEGVSELVATAEMQKSRTAAKTLGERSLPERVRSILRGADAAMLKIETMAKWLDGDDLNGPWVRMLIRPIAVAQGREEDLRRQYVKEINEHVTTLPKKLVARWGDKVDTPELVNALVPSLTKDQVVMMAMNWGNEGNKQRLLDGYHWEEASVLQVFSRVMTKEDWDFVQKVWDTVDKLWPDAAALERRVNGLAPERVEAVPVTTPHGVYRGGYFPAIYDASLSSRAAIDEDNKMSPEGGSMMVTTRAGSTRQRAEAVRDRPILLSMAVITRHLGEAIHDITHREAVMQAKKILGDKRIGDVVRNQLGPEYLKAMGGWMENIARPGSMYSKSSPAMVRLGRYLNKAVAMVGLGFRVSTSAMQLLGLPVAIGEVGEKHMAKALAIVTSHPIKAWNEMTSRSAAMRARADTLDATIEDMVHQHTAGKLQTIGPKGFQKYAMRGIAYMDMVVTTTVWTAGFNKALEQGLSEEDAVHYADSTIRTTQGGGGQLDRSGIMNEHPMVRSLYAFFSYLNALFNMQRDVFRLAGEGQYGEAARKAWWVMICPMLLQAAIFGQGRTAATTARSMSRIGPSTCCSSSASATSVRCPASAPSPRRSATTTPTAHRPTTRWARGCSRWRRTSSTSTPETRTSTARPSRRPSTRSGSSPPSRPARSQRLLEASMITSRAKPTRSRSAIGAIC
jgi:hypothetical protein